MAKADFRPLTVIFELENLFLDVDNLYMDVESPCMVVENSYMDLETPYMDHENLYTDLDNLYMNSKNRMQDVYGKGFAPAPPLAPPARVMLMRGRAEYRRSPSGTHEMCVPPGQPAKCVFPSLLVVFVVVVLHEKSKTCSTGNKVFDV